MVLQSDGSWVDRRAATKVVLLGYSMAERSAALMVC